MLDEPIAESQGAPFDAKNRPPGMVQEVHDIVLDGVSLMAVEESTGRLAGFRASSVFKR